MTLPGTEGQTMTRDEIVEALAKRHAQASDAVWASQPEMVRELLRDKARVTIAFIEGAELALTAQPSEARVIEAAKTTIPEQYRYLKFEPKTPAEDGWNARCLGADRERNPHFLIRFDDRQAWFDGFDECGAYLSQEIG